MEKNKKGEKNLENWKEKKIEKLKKNRENGIVLISEEKDFIRHPRKMQKQLEEKEMVLNCVIEQRKSEQKSLEKGRDFKMVCFEILLVIVIFYIRLIKRKERK
jgi:predicted urease superfamily metal-dependent hydrolase